MAIDQMDVPDFYDISVDAQCKALGLKTYDIALPQGWFDEFFRFTGESPCGIIVWCYDKSVFGLPTPICCKGERLLSEYNEKK